MLLTAAGHTGEYRGRKSLLQVADGLTPTVSLSALPEACPVWATGLTQQDISFFLKR